MALCEKCLPKPNNWLGHPYCPDCSNNCNQGFVITCNESLLPCGGILAHSFLQNCCYSVTLEGFWAAFLRSCHSISIGFRSELWLGHSSGLVKSSFSFFRGGLLVCLDHCPAAEPNFAQLEVTNRWPDILLQDYLVDSRIHGSIYHSKSSRSRSSKTAPDHHTTTTIFYCWYDVLFLKCSVTFTPDVMGHTPSKKFNFCLVIPECFPKSLGDHEEVFWGKLDKPTAGLTCPVKVSVHDSTIRKRQGKNGLHSRFPRRKPLLSYEELWRRIYYYPVLISMVTLNCVFAVGNNAFIL